MLKLKRLRDKTPAIVCGLAMICLALARLHTRHEPFERDIATYAVIGHELLAGRPLYSDLWDNKPPGIFLTFAGAERLFGYGDRTILILNFFATFLTLIAVYFAGRFGKSKTAGLWAAAIWAILACDIDSQANQPNTEVFINACLTGSFALWLRFRRLTREEKGRFLTPVWIGTLGAIASFYKQVALAPLLLMMVFEFFQLGREGISWRKRCRLAAAFFLPVLLIWGCATFYFAATDRLNIWRETLFYAYNYAGSLKENLLGLLKFRTLFPSCLAVLRPLPAIIVLGIIKDRDQLGKSWTLAAFFGLGALIALALPGKFFSHYYQLLLPLFAILSGWAIASFQSFQTSLGLFALGGLLIHLWPLYRLTPDQISTRKYTPIFVQTRNLGREIKKSPDQGSMYHWGNDPGVYYYSRSRPATGVLWRDSVVMGSLKEAFKRRLQSDLQKNPPLFFILDRNCAPDLPDFLAKWSRISFQPYPVNQSLAGPFEAYIRSSRR